MGVLINDQKKEMGMVESMLLSFAETSNYLSTISPAQNTQVDLSEHIK